jgi:DivIVA domain-containing protein
VGTVLGYIIALLVVGGLLFLAASYTFGRGEEMAPVLPDGTPVELPDDRLAGGDDLRALRLSVAVRGYRMDEVDWLLDRLSEQVDTRDREIARLRSVLHVEPVEEPADREAAAEDHSAADHSAADHSAAGEYAADEYAAGEYTAQHARPDGVQDEYAGRRPRPVPEGTADTGARPNRPARDIRTDQSPE